jgi:replication factor A1
MVKNPGELKEIPLKIGGTKSYRAITLTDSSDKDIDIRLWEEATVRTNLEKYEIYFFKRMKVRVYKNEKHLSLDENSKICHDKIDNAEYKKMTEWKIQQMKTLNCRQATNSIGCFSENEIKMEFATIREMSQRSREFFSHFHNDKKRLWFEFTGFVDHISHNVWYEACTSIGCNKKVVNENSLYYCPKCKNSSDKSVPRFMTGIRIADGTDFLTARLFGPENCLSLFYKNVNELKQIRDQSERKFLSVLRDIEKTEFSFRAFAKMNNFNEESKVSFEIVGCRRIEEASEEISKRIVERMFAQVLA